VFAEKGPAIIPAVSGGVFKRGKKERGNLLAFRRTGTRRMF